MKVNIFKTVMEIILIKVYHISEEEEKNNTFDYLIPS